MKAAGGVLTAKQAPPARHRPGARSARLGDVHFILWQTASSRNWKASCPMPTSSLRLAVVALIAAGVSVIIGYDVGVRSRARPSLCELSALHYGMDDRGQADVEQKRLLEILTRRSTVKDWALRELLARRMTLGQTAAQFRAIERELPLPWRPSPQADGPGENERLCRDVIDRAHGWVTFYLPAEADRVTARLEAEL